MILQSKRILLGVTGGIAAYKACLLVRELQKQGAEVRVVMTQAATQMVGVETFRALTRQPVGVGIFDANSDLYFQHIEWAKWAELVLVAPCTANTLGNLAGGLTPDLLSLLWMASRAPKAIVPAMNTGMWESPAVQRNLQILAGDGVAILNPSAGELACGDIGPGRFPELSEVVDFIASCFFAKPNGRTVLIAMGRTEEPLDPVRFLTNRSSGKTGLILAWKFAAMGYKVQIVAGPCDVAFPNFFELQSVRTVAQMQAALNTAFVQADVLIMAASIADFRPAHIASQKIKASRELLEIQLEPNPDLLAHFSKLKTPRQIVVGFALESEDVRKHGFEKFARKGCDFMLVNAPLQQGSGIGFDQVEYALLSKGDLECPPLRLASKAELAEELSQSVERALEAVVL
jgi:phosphopantothenoylcysteine decarboxylase/phosphopantothenate--cysteine ligase